MAKKPAEAAAAPVAAPAQDPAAETPTVAAEPAAEPEQAPADEAPAAAPEEPAEAAAAPAADEQAEAPAEENVVDGFIDGDTLVPMSHPDNGSCDAYETDKGGHLLVPAIEVPKMLSHGFTVAAGDDA